MSTPLKVIETNRFLMKIYPKYSYLEYYVKEGVTIDVETVKQGRKMVTDLYPGRKFYVYAEGYSFFTLTQEARKFCATKEYSDNTIAIAFYTPNISLLLLGEMYTKINKPFVSTEIFSKKNKAEEWLKKQMKLNGLKNQIKFEDLLI